jgi:hypothetical protein
MDRDSVVGYCLCALALVFAALVLSSCADAPGAYTFQQVPAIGPARTKVVVEDRYALLADVVAECRTRGKLYGGKDPLACQWSESGRPVVLCAYPRDVNDHQLIEACGHEHSIHILNIYDHR